MFKLTYFLPLAFLFSLAFVSCEKEEDEPEQEEETIEVNTTSVIPSTTSGRPNNYLGCVQINSRITSIEVWDHGQIDGDIVSILANGTTIIDEVELDGPNNPVQVDYDFGFNGFNYVTLYAHNLGDLPPNTCTIAINGVEFILEANLDANGSIDVIVGGFGVDCSDSGGGSTGGGSGGSGNGGSGGSGGSGGGPTPGDVKFWTSQDFGCGNITVNVSGAGSSSISGFFDSGAPDCNNSSAGGNFNDLAPGNYSFTASCTDRNWNGTITIEEGRCLIFELR